jgi:hypothetical protein
MTETTAAQDRAIKAILEAGKDRRISDGEYSHPVVVQHEVKKLANTNLVSVVVETALEDETGLQSLLCRRYGHFIVGPRGGIKIAGVSYSDEYKGKRANARRFPLIYGWR